MFVEELQHHFETADAASPTGHKITVGPIASECLRDASGDWEQARKLFLTRLSEDAELCEQLIWPLIDSAIIDAIRKAARVVRTKIGRRVDINGNGSGHKPAADDASGLEAMAKTNMLTMLDYPLPGTGKPLGDAGLRDLQEAIEIHRMMASTNAHKARFLVAVSKKIKDGQIVRDVFGDEAIDRLYQAAKYG